MNRSRLQSHLTALIIAIVAYIGLLSLSSAPAWAAAGTITGSPRADRCSHMIRSS